MEGRPSYHPLVRPALDHPAYPGPDYPPLTVQEQFKYDRLLVRAYTYQMLKIDLEIEDVGRYVVPMMAPELAYPVTEDQLLGDMKAQIYRYRHRYYERLAEFLKRDDYFVILPDLVKQHVSKTALVIGDSKFLPTTRLMQDLGQAYGLINLSAEGLNTRGAALSLRKYLNDTQNRAMPDAYATVSIQYSGDRGWDAVLTVEKALIHLGSNDSIFPEPNAAKATDEECVRCIEEGRPWPENNRHQNIDQCLHYLDKVITMIKPGFRLINIIFVPPVLPGPKGAGTSQPGRANEVS